MNSQEAGGRESGGATLWGVNSWLSGFRLLSQVEKIRFRSFQKKTGRKNHLKEMLNK